MTTLFISGSFEGISQDIRIAVRRTLSELDCQVLEKSSDMEAPTAQLIDNSDVIIFICGEIIPPIQNVYGITLVEMELQYAIDKGKTILPILSDVKDEKKLPPKIKALRGLICRCFDSSLVLLKNIYDISRDVPYSEGEHQRVIEVLVEYFRHFWQAGWRKSARALKEPEKYEASVIIKSVHRALIEKIVDNPKFLDGVDWRTFERLMANVFEGIGFDVVLTPPSKDGGKDIVLCCMSRGTKKKYFIELKHWPSGDKVSDRHVQKFEIIVSQNADAGLLLSTSGFTKSVTKIKRNKVYLGDKKLVVALCETYLSGDHGLALPAPDLNFSRIVQADD